MRPPIIFAAVFLVSAFLVVPAPARAYVDPGLGGQVFQIGYLAVIGVVGFVVTPFLLFGRSIIRSVRRVFRLRHRESPVSQMDHPEGKR